MQMLCESGANVERDDGQWRVYGQLGGALVVNQRWRTARVLVDFLNSMGKKRMRVPATRQDLRTYESTMCKTLNLRN
jgi:hypothetical protein